MSLPLIGEHADQIHWLQYLYIFLMIVLLAHFVYHTPVNFGAVIEFCMFIFVDTRAACSVSVKSKHQQGTVTCYNNIFYAGLEIMCQIKWWLLFEKHVHK